MSPWQLSGDLEGTTDTRPTIAQSVRVWVGAQREGRWSEAAGLESLAQERHLAMTSDWATTRRLEVEGPAGWLPKWKEMDQFKSLREKQWDAKTIPLQARKEERRG